MFTFIKEMKRSKNLNFSSPKFEIASILRGRARFQFYNAFSGPITSTSAALKRIFLTFPYEITRGAVRVI